MNYYNSTFFAYDTICNIRIGCLSENSAVRILHNTETIAHKVEKTLSMYDPESKLSVFCKNYIPGIPLEVSKDLYEFLQFNLEMAELTSGRFDPTAGPLIKTWNFLSENPTIPSEKTIEKTLARVGYQHIKLLPDRKICVDIENIQIDPGAAGKGFSLQLAADYLVNSGITEAVLDFGGNLYTIGGKEKHNGEWIPWKAGIKDPADRTRIIGTVPLLNSGIATSSWYEHYFKKDGIIYHHILDTKTGYPIKMDFQSVSVISSSALYTDILSTILFMSEEKAVDDICSEISLRHNISIEYIAVTVDGRIKFSRESGFQKYV